MLKKLTVLILFIFFTSATYAQSLILATYQYADNNRIENILPLANHLKEKLGFDITVRSYPTVHKFIEAIRKDEVDIALINTFGYLLLDASSTPYPMSPALALVVKQGAKDNYKTVFVAPYKSPIDSLQAIKKHAAVTKLMLVNMGSTSGNLVPRLALSSLGLNNAEQDFKSMVYGNTHKATIDSVAAGNVGLGAVGSSEYFAFVDNAENQNKIKQVWISPEIPLGPVLLNNKMPSVIRDSLVQAFLSLDTINAAALEAVKNGWSEAKQAEKFILIDSTYYDPFKKQLGKPKHLQKILKQFAN